MHRQTTTYLWTKEKKNVMSFSINFQTTYK